MPFVELSLNQKRVVAKNLINDPAFLAVSFDSHGGMKVITHDLKPQQVDEIIVHLSRLRTEGK